MSSPITHIQEQVIVQSGSGTSVADIGKWAPGYTPVIVKALCVLVRVVPSCAGVVSLEKRVTLQSDSSRVVLLCGLGWSHARIRGPDDAIGGVCTLLGNGCGDDD